MNPVQYDAQNQAIVDEFNARLPDQKDPEYWSDPVVNPVRGEIKDHYIAEQNRRCCYCDREYPTNNKAVWEGEHIIARTKAPRFMFEPRNLSACCKDCNNAKREGDVRVDPDRVSFPDESHHYRIVHPHFDRYEDHIRWYGDVVKPLTPKGGELIALCNLYRFGFVKAGADVTPANSLVDNMIGIMMDPQASAANKAIAVAAYREYVKTIPQKPA